MARFAEISAETTCITPSGRGGRLPAGTYPVVDIDGAADRNVLYVRVDADLMCVSATDAHLRVLDREDS